MKDNESYRGNDLTSKYTLDELSDLIQTGKFNENDLYIGDFLKINMTINEFTDTYKWVFSGFDTFFNYGDEKITKHHIVMIPENILMSKPLNNKNTTENGYIQSNFWKNEIEWLSNNLQRTFNNHVLKFRQKITNSIDKNKISNELYKWYGYSNGNEWIDCYCDLLSEEEVFGIFNFNDSFYEKDYDEEYYKENEPNQFPIFKLNEKFKIGNNHYYNWWLRTIASKEKYCFVYKDGTIFGYNATYSLGIRPFFLFY